MIVTQIATNVNDVHIEKKHNTLKNKGEKHNKRQPKKNPFGGRVMTQNQIDMYAEAVGLSYWRQLGKGIAAHLIDLGYRRPLEHKIQKDGQSIPIPNSWWGMLNPALRKFLQEQVFEVTNPKNENGVFTMAWRLRPVVYRRIANMNYTPKLKGKLIEVSTGKRVINIASISSDGRKLRNVARLVTLNMQALNAGVDAMPGWIKYFEDGEKGAKPTVYAKEMTRVVKRKKASNVGNRSINIVMAEYCERALMEMTAFIEESTAIDSKGQRMTLYTRSDSGREYASGLSLQSCTTLARATALHGCYQLDFEACHQTIAVQLSRQWDDCPKLKYLSMVVDNKEGIRKQFHDLVNTPSVGVVSESAIKAGLLMPMYGATKTLWHKGAYVSTLTKAGYLKIQKSELFQKYVEDVETFQFHLLDKCERSKSGRAVNCLGLVAPVGSTPAQEVAHLMQGYESQAMAGAVAQTSSATLWQHDAVICCEPEDIKDMQKGAKLASGFDLKIERTRYDYSGLPELKCDVLMA